MNQIDAPLFEELINLAKQEFKRGNKSQVHYWASRAARLSPSSEEPWLILAAVGDPKASVFYADQALHLNPGSVRALKALDWAKNRRDELGVSLAANPYIPVDAPLASPQTRNNRRLPRPRLKNTLRGVIISFLLCSALFLITAIPAGWVLANDLPFGNVYISFSPKSASPIGSSENEKIPSPSPINPIPSPLAPTHEIISTATSLPTLTSTWVSASTQASTFTETPLPEPSSTLLPPDLSVPADVLMPVIEETSNRVVNEDPIQNDSYLGEHWIDVDLTNQIVYAFDGDQVVNTFVVSTGTKEHPTVTGQYHIYLKFRFDDMSGPGYYLPDVPYTMYFYKGYGLHGTYWHDNFGTPMSHGCINLRTEDAAWLFDFASEGTLVNIHY